MLSRVDIHYFSKKKVNLMMGKAGLMKAVLLIALFVGCFLLSVSANEGTLKELATIEIEIEEFEVGFLRKVINFLWQGKSGYVHVWPDMKFGWEIIVGSLIGFFGAAFWYAGSIDGGGIFVPMLTVIIGFDSKTSIAISTCMIMGGSVSTFYNTLKKRYPSLEMPVIDYDLVLLLQPMMVLGISIGVALNVMFADWMITALLTIAVIIISIEAWNSGVYKWGKETYRTKDVYALGGEWRDDITEVPPRIETVSIMDNVRWPQVGVLCFVWLAVLGLNIAQKYTSTCSIGYWSTNLLQILVAVGASGYEAYMLYTGKRKLTSQVDDETHWKVHQLVLYCLVGLSAGIVGGSLGLAREFILGRLILDIGITPQVSSATATFIMMFSSSIIVVEYYLLNRFPVPYAVYFVTLAIFAALVSEILVRRWFSDLHRYSKITLILAFTSLAGAISLGGVGLSNLIHKSQHNEYIGFDSLCASEA